MKCLTFVLSLMFAFSLLAQEEFFYVSDAANFSQGPWKIWRYDADGSNESVYIDVQLAWPQDVLFVPGKDEVLVSNLNSNKITRYRATSGEYINDFATGLSGPTRMKIGPDGDLYVLQWSGSGLVMKYDLDGVALGSFTQTGVNQSIGMDWDASGHLFVSSYQTGEVYEFDGQGILIDTIATNSSGPTNIQRLSNGNWLVLNFNSGILQLFDASWSSLGTPYQGLNQCEGVWQQNNGNLVIGKGQDGRVFEFNNQWLIIDTLVQTSADLIRPNAVVFGNHEAHLSLTEKKSDPEFKIVGRNLVLNSEAHHVKCYSTAGKLLFEENLDPLTSTFDLPEHLKGVVLVQVYSKYGYRSKKVYLSK